MRSFYFYSRSKLSNTLSDGVARFIVQSDVGSLAEGLGNCSGGHLLIATDALKSTVNCVSRHAAPYNPIGYSVYGYCHNERGQRLGASFVGQRYDDGVGGYHLGAGYRVYNPILMRFLSPDSWSPFGGGGVNGYVYAGNDPVNADDPTGHIISPAQWQSIMTNFLVERYARQRAQSLFTAKLPGLPKDQQLKVIQRSQQITDDYRATTANKTHTELASFVREDPDAMTMVFKLSADRTDLALSQGGNSTSVSGLVGVDLKYLDIARNPRVPQDIKLALQGLRATALETLSQQQGDATHRYATIMDLIVKETNKKFRSDRRLAIFIRKRF